METVASLINEGDFSWRATVIENPTLEQIKNEIINGRPVIVPVYAMALTNPVYESGAVDYHTVVVIGYDDSRKVFITHDPGTSRGEKFAYQYQEFYDAIHDLNESNYTDGPRRAVFTERK
jgi:predicted double-glycine peptidase